MCLLSAALDRKPKSPPERPDPRTSSGRGPAQSFGLAALEDMACSVVPIATRVGGLPEVVEHGTSGFLADVGDVETMARFAIDLLSSDDRLKQMSAAAREVALSRFCSDRIIPEYEEFYRRVLERSS